MKNINKTSQLFPSWNPFVLFYFTTLFAIFLVGRKIAYWGFIQMLTYGLELYIII